MGAGERGEVIERAKTEISLTEGEADRRRGGEALEV